MNTHRFSLRKLLPVAVISVATLTVSSAYAGGFFGHGHHRGDMMAPIERMIDHVDLSSLQEEQVEEIIKNAGINTKTRGDIRRKYFGQMIKNNPDNADYMLVAEQQADSVASEVKEKILLMAKVRQEVYNILTDEQKLELEAHINKKMQRMKKRRQD